MYAIRSYYALRPTTAPPGPWTPAQAPRHDPAAMELRDEVVRNYGQKALIGVAYVTATARITSYNVCYTKLLRLTDDKAEALAQLDAGKRAIALMDAKKFDYAEKELRQIDPRISKKVQEAMMAVAHNIGAPDFEMRLGRNNFV